MSVKLVVEVSESHALALARELAARFGAYLFCQCGREKIGDDGTCPRCAEDERSL